MRLWARPQLRKSRTNRCGYRERPDLELTGCVRSGERRAAPQVRFVRLPDGTAAAFWPSGVFVIDSKQWTGSVHQSPDGLAWHNHYPP